MSRRDLSQFDASAQAASELEYVIKAKRPSETPTPKTVPVSEALRQGSVRQSRSDRDVTRVLFISQDTELLNPAQQSLDGFLDISKLFAEVHILILREGIPPIDPVLRVADNVWLYTAAASHWWQVPRAGVKLASEQLQFATGFRPDLIVARDPFESAVVARRLGNLFKRPTQLHILEDFTSREFVQRRSHNYWRRFLPRFTIPHFQSVRTGTTRIHGLLCEKYRVPDCQVLPKFQNYQEILSRDDALDLANTFAPISFFMLYVGELTHNSSLFQILQAAQTVLKNRRVGLIVLGDGYARAEFEAQAKTLGIAEQVVFKSQVTDIVPYLLDADVLFATDTDAPSESVVLQAAAAGTPMIMARTPARRDLFTHQSSTYFCEPGRVEALKAGIELLLEHVSIREHFSAAAKRVMRDKFHADPKVYQEAYRRTIEDALFIGDPVLGE